MAAVEIPVVIDIEGAFEDAAKRVGSAMRPMKQAIEEDTAKIKLKIGTEWDDWKQMYVPVKKSLEDIIGLTAKLNRQTGKTTYSLTANTQQLSVALEDAKNQYARLSAMEEKGLKIDYDKLDAYREAITVLMSEIDLRQRNVRFVEKATLAEINRVNAINEGNYALVQETKTMAQLSDKISALRGKLNNLNPQKDKKEWTETAKEIEKATAAYEKLQAKLQKPSGGPGSITRIREEMTKLEQQWNALSKKRKFDENGQLTASAQKLVDKFKQLAVESEKYGQSLSTAAGVAKQKVDSTTSSMRAQYGVLGQLKSMAASYISVFGLLRLAKQLRDVTGELEYQRVALGRLIQDEQYGAELFERIKQEAQRSPFRIQQLVTYTKQLAAYRIEQENLFDTTKRLADISAGLGVDMNRLILAYGQVRAASVLRGQELRQFTEAGIPLVELLAEKMGELNKTTYTTADVFRLISERAVPFSAIASIFEDLTEKGGMFYKMQEKQAETLKGRWEKLKDAFDIGLQTAGETMAFQVQNDLLLKTLTFLAKNIKIIPTLIEAMGVAWVSYNAITLITSLRHKSIATTAAAAMTQEQLLGAGVSKNAVKMLGCATATKLLTRANAVLAASNGFLSRSFARLTMAMLTNPYLAVGAAVLGLVASLAIWRKKTDEANDSVVNLDRSIENLAAATKDYSKTDALIQRYSDLANNTKRTEGESAKLAKTISDLRERFPQLSMSIDDDTTKIYANTEALKLNNEERMKMARKEALRDLGLAKSQLTNLEEERGPLEESYFKIRRRMQDYEDGLGRRREDLSDQQKKQYKELTDEATKARDALAQVDEKISDTTKDISRIREYLDGSKKAVSAWKKQLESMQLASNGAQIFSNEQLEKWYRLYDVSTDLEKEWKRLKEELKAMQAAAPKVGSKYFDEWSKNVKDIESKITGLDIIKAFFDFDWGKKASTGSQTDPFIVNMKDRIKFMKDFRNGYEDLRKYMGDQYAEENEAKIMMGRGLSLGLDAKEQSRAVSDLIGWYRDAIKDVVKKLKAQGVTGPSVSDILAIDTTKRGKYVQDLQALLQQLWDGLTDFRTDEMKKKLDDAIKKVKDELKRSEAAKNFFNDILGLTGDEELAANMAVSVYGDPGKELGDRIRQSIADALNAPVGEGPSVTAAQRSAIENAAKNLDFREVLKEVDQYPDHVRDAVKEAADIVEKYNADTAKSYIKLLTQFDEITQKRKTIEQKAADDIKVIEEGLAIQLRAISSDTEKALETDAGRAAKERADAAIDAINRQKDLDLLRTSRNYRLFFESIGTISLSSARKIAKAERDIVTAQFEAGEISLSKYTRELDKIDERLKKYEEDRSPIVTYLTKGFDGLFDKIEQAGRNLTALTGNMKDDEGNFSIPEGLEKLINVLGKIFGGGFFGIEGVKGRKNVFDQMKEQLGDNEEEWEKMSEKTSEKLSQMSKDMAAGIGWADFWVSFAGGSIKAFDQIAQKSKNTEGEVKEGWNKVAKFIITSAAGMLVGAPITAGLAGQMWDVDDAWERFTGLNEKAMSGFEKFKQGDLIGALIDNIEGWAEVFGVNTKKIDREIKQQSQSIEELQYQYSRLDVAIQKAFGSDYISLYNQQLEKLNAQAEAYRKQAELERSKGKKADEDTAKGYEKSAREVEDQITDMQTQLSEFMSGTDLTSAAKEFAEAWVEAYKEFGSTTDAVKEKFNDMIQNMVVNSLAAQLIQSILKPIFDQIDSAASDGALTAQEIAQISAMVPGAIDQINGAMTGMVSELTAAGYNLRSQAGSFTGISRDIATASEESITGLAAGINTQNFYISHIDANVAAILSALTGGASTPGASVTGEYVDPYKDFVMKNIELYFPSFDQKLGDILNRLDRVIRPRTDRPDYVIHTNL